MALANEVDHYRTGVANLLADSVIMTCNLARWLDVTGGWQETTAQFDLDADPTVSLRINCALMLRKARLHLIAVLQANETNNLHSLGVQMRPVLECAGQAVFLFHNLVIAPDSTMERERALHAVSDYLNAAAYRQIIEATRGGIEHKELLEMTSETEAEAAASVGMPKPKMRKKKSLNQADKVASLAGGKRWYDYLSEHFCHDGGNLRGPSWRGGVISTSTIQDKSAFAILMDYLVEQVVVMNAYVAWCPVAGGTGQWIESTLAQLRAVRKSSKALREAAIAGATGREQDANVRTD